MRTRIKTIFSIMTAIVVICSLSVIVSANEKTLVYTGQNSDFTYEYYSDNSIVIYPQNNYILLGADRFNDYMNEETKVVFDCSSSINNSYYLYLRLDGTDCPVRDFSFTGTKLSDLRELSFYNFEHDIDSVNFPQDTSLFYLFIYNCKFTSLDFVKGGKINTLSADTCSLLKNVSISYSVSSIRLSQCENIAGIDVPDGLNDLYIYNAPLFTSFNVPSTLKLCSLYDVTIKDISVPKNCNFNIRSNELETATLITGRKQIDSWMFNGCSNLKNVNIPYGVTSIQYAAFQGCTNLKSVTLPDTVQTIWTRAFMDSGITSISIPSGVTKIEYGTFRNCKSLSSIVIPDTVTQIDAGAFYGTDALKTVDFGGSRTDWYNIEIIDRDDVKTIDQVFKNATVTFGSFIEKQPKNFIGQVGTTAQFAVETTDGSEYTYQWQYLKGDTWVNSTQTGAKTAQLSVKVTDARDGQRYRCKVKSVTGRTIYSNESSIYVGKPLSISKMPENAYVSSNEAAVFKVVATGEGVTYTWQVYRDHTWMWEGNEDTLTIRSYSWLYDPGLKIRCIVKDKFGTSITTNTVSIIQGAPLSIIKNPVDFTGTEGSKAKFTVEAEGNGIKYQWQYKTATGSWKNSNSAGFDTSSMSVKITAARDGQLYRCKITDTYDNFIYSEPATIHMANQVLTIKKQPSDYSGQVGEKATFTVTAEGDELNYQWQYLTSSGVWKNSNSEGSTTASMSIKVTDARNGQKYMCVITDKYGNRITSETASIAVVQAPAFEIISQPVNYAGKIGSTATFTVRTDTDGLTYQWQYKKGDVWKNSTSEGCNTDTLSIKVTEARDGQTYQCVITDQNGRSITSSSASINVIYIQVLPVISTQPKSYYGLIGETAVFTVEASGEELTYQWQYSKDGVTWKNSSATGFDTDSLSVKITEARAYQQYRCVITDKNGNQIESDGASIVVIMEA